MGLLKNYMYYSQLFAIVTSFIFSLTLLKNKKIPKYLKNFFWYPTIGVVVILPEIFDLNFNASEIFIINNLSILFHYSFLSLFIIRIIPQNRKWWYLKYIFITFFIAIIIYLFCNDLSKPQHLAFAISNFGLTIFCILYYFYLFNSSPTLNLLNEPSFWIVTGIFFSMTLIVPITSVIEYLCYKPTKKTYMIFANMLMFCYTIMHVFFIKAFLCTIQIDKT